MNYGTDITESIEWKGWMFVRGFLVKRSRHICRSLFHVFLTTVDFWVVTPCTFVEVYQHFEGILYVHRKKTEAVDSSLTLVITCWTAPCHIPHNLYVTYWRKLQSSSDKRNPCFFHTYMLCSFTVNIQSDIRILRTVLIGNWCSFWRCTAETRDLFSIGIVFCGSTQPGTVGEKLELFFGRTTSPVDTSNS